MLKLLLLYALWRKSINFKIREMSREVEMTTRKFTERSSVDFGEDLGASRKTPKLRKELTRRTEGLATVREFEFD